MTLKNFLFFILSLSFWQVSAQESSTHCSKMNRHMSQTKSATLTVAQIAETEKYDVHFYRLDLNMNNISTHVNGTGSIHATAKQAIDSALFELFSSLTITQVRVNSIPVGFSRVLSAVKVPVNVNANQAFIIDVDYEGTPPTAQTNPLGGSGMTAAASPSWEIKSYGLYPNRFPHLNGFPVSKV